MTDLQAHIGSDPNPVGRECYHPPPGGNSWSLGPFTHVSTSDTIVPMRRIHPHLSGWSVIAASCFASLAVAQLDQSELESVETGPRQQPNMIYTVETAPEIDGVLEEIWQYGTPLKGAFRQVNPEEGAPPSQRTEVYLMRDARNFYVGFRCFDDDPSAISATQMRYDGDFDPDDNVTIVIDPFRDRSHRRSASGWR